MINFLHTFNPDPVLISLGPIHIYWYGFFIVLGIILAIAISVFLAKKYGIAKDEIYDLAFWLIVGGIIGARIFHILIEWRYYWEQPLDMFKVWQGGLAIHGAIMAGLIGVWLYAKKRKINFWILTSALVPGLALAQALGRWGNYFNQELFGRPTGLPWGIQIDIAHRPFQYITQNYFHPAFLYESLGSLLVFGALIIGHRIVIKKYQKYPISYKILALGYLFLYSILRFLTEFIRIDEAYYFLEFRHAQITSLAIMAAAVVYFFYSIKRKSRGMASS